MLLRNFYIDVIIRILAILASCITIAICWVWKPDWLIISNLALLIVLQIVLLILKITRLNKDLELFFLSMQSNDSNLAFTTNKKFSPFKELYEQLEKINNDFQHLKIQNHKQNEYFRILVEHVNVGLLSFLENGEIGLYNRAAKEILGKKSMRNVVELDYLQHGLSVIVRDLEPTDQKLISFYSNNSIQQLLFRAAWIKLEDSTVKLVSFQNIRNELDEKELESWQKLIRVLTHELMNSAGPINSTIATIKEFLVDTNGEAKPIKSLSDHTIEDAVEGLKIIEERSTGMMDFVSKFRSLTLLPKPTFSSFPISDLFRTVELLMTDRIQNSKIKYSTTISPSNLKITADKGMMEQILLNLINNAILALENYEKKVINLSASIDQNQRPIIQVSDNGAGIPIEIQDKIFIPFFTTRKDGSGIGLSLSRQLVQLLGGTLTFNSIQNEMTVFTIKL